MRNGLISGVVRRPGAIDKQACADVGVGVGDDHGEVGGGVEFARVSRGGAAGVAAADGNQVHQEEAFPPLFRRHPLRRRKNDTVVHTPPDEFPNGHPLPYPNVLALEPA